MIPILYSDTETTFTSNGIGRLRDCISCRVTEERNGKYECEFKYPVTGKRYADIVEGCFISVTHDDTGDRQPFIIYRRSAPINGVVTFNAHHVSYQLNNVVLNPFTAGSATEVMAKIPINSINTNTFTFWTDKETTANFNLSNPASVRSILGGSRGSVLDTFGGGEYEFTNYTVKLYQRRGTDTDVTIRYGKNMADLEQQKDVSGVYNAIVPFWAGGEGDNVVMLDEKIVIADGVTNAVPVARDFSADFQNEPTQAQLRARAKSFLSSNKPWVPDENIKVDFVQLWQTSQYKDVASLQRVKLCDTVNVYYPKLGVTAEGVKIIRIVYNVLLDRYDEMELGDARSTFAETVLKQAAETLATSGFVKTTAMQKAIDHATKLITGGLGGHVVFNLNADGEPEEILVMDTDDTATAENVWRFNLGGLGHSHSGYSGPFDDVALTMDGHINASMITVGTLNANIIKTGVLADSNNNVMFNLSTGELTMNKGSINIGNGVFSVTTAGALTASNASLRGELVSISGANYTRLKNGRFDTGAYSNGTYTEHGFVDGSYETYSMGSLVTKNLAVCSKTGNVIIGAKYVQFKDSNLTANQDPYVYINLQSTVPSNSWRMHVKNGGAYIGGDSWINGDLKTDDLVCEDISCTSIECDSFSMSGTANRSNVCIPASVNSDGTIGSYYEYKIVHGIIMIK